VWVSGPPGSGKTVLLSSYIDFRKLPCLWYQIDEGDSDIATFFYYMGLAVKKAVPHKRRALPLFTPEYQTHISTFTRQFFDELFGRLAPPFIVVFDNYQEINPSSPLHKVIKNMLLYIPEGVNVVIISRDSLAGELVKLRANRKLSIVTWKDLQLTLRESKHIIYARRHISEKIMRAMHERVDGWVAGLVLMLETADKEGLEHISVEKFSHHEIFDYFASEIFNRISPATQSFLLKTSILPYMTGEIARKLTGISRAEKILSNLYQKNYFILKQPGAVSIYQYHALFKDFLLSYANNTYSWKEIIMLRQKAARLLEDAGKVEEAAPLYIMASDWQRLTTLIIHHAEKFITSGRNQMLEQWLNSIPHEVLSTTPWLFYWLGICRLPFDPRQSYSCFKETFKQFMSQKDQVGMFMSCFSAIDAILYEQADFNLLDYWIRVLEEMFNADPIFLLRR
jgi:ATP/maltotriose-dependent transcriptional regulator MalT